MLVIIIAINARDVESAADSQMTSLSTNRTVHPTIADTTWPPAADEQELGKVYIRNNPRSEVQ